MAKVDWIEIKNEYINTGISQRKLAEKYKISFNTLKDKAHKESWAKLKKKQHNKITTKTQQKTAEIIVEKEVDRITSLMNLTDTAQEKISVGFSQLTKYLDMFGNVHDSDVIDVNKLRKLVSALKDIKDIIKTNNDESDSNGMLSEIIKAVENIE